MMKFEVFKGSDGQYYFHVRSSNGQKILQSEGYSRKESAMGTIESIKSGAATASVVDLTKCPGDTMNAISERAPGSAAGALSFLGPAERKN